MTTEVDLLNTIHEYADMGSSGAESQVIPLSSDPSPLHQRAPASEKRLRRLGFREAEALLEERHIPRGKEARTCGQRRQHQIVMTRAKNLADPSTSKLAGDGLPGKQTWASRKLATKVSATITGEDKTSLKLCRKTAETGRTPRRDHETVSLSYATRRRTGGRFFS